MNYGGIPDYILDSRLGETFEGEYTLRNELDNVGEDIIWYDFEAETQPETGIHHINWFYAYTENKVLSLQFTIFGDMSLISMDRNPPTP